jgi:cell division protein FtsB
MRSKVKRFHFLKPIPIAATLLLLAGGTWFVLGPNGMWDAYRLRKEKWAQRDQIARLEAQKEKLQKYYGALKTGDEFALERAAREHGLVASNEFIYDVKIDSTK